MKNCDMRKNAAGQGVKLWQIAERLNISDANFSRKLRKELLPKEKEEILDIIMELTEEMKKCQE